MKVIVAGDHASLEMKGRVVDYLKKQHHEVEDVGVYNEDSVDYPDIVAEGVKRFWESKAHRIILICGTGVGVSIAANKHTGILCALVRDVFTAKMATIHNHANCIAIGARVEYSEPIEDILEGYFSSVPEQGRHERRVKKILDLEK